MKLAALAARIDVGVQVGQVGEQRSSKSRPAKLAGNFRGSMQVSRARRPAAIMSRASASVGMPQIGNSGVSPVPRIRSSRYRRTSSRNRSPNATAVTPSPRARSIAAAIAASYCALLHG